MADYVYIKNTSNKGELAISRHVFEALATEAVDRVIGAKVAVSKSKSKRIAKLFNPVKVVFHSNGQVEITISITLSKGANVNKVCLNLQEEVGQSLLAYTESVPFEIKIKVASID